MRKANIVLTVLLSGCAVGAGGSHGVTHAEHVGSMQVIFTNATPDKMCELHMSFEDKKDFGDNWLPEAGLASGKSIEFKVKPGKYQATWNTCPSGDKPYYAGTLIGEFAIGVDQQTQLFTYVADRVAPTKRAPVLGRDYKVVKFSGQEIMPIGKAAPVKTDAFAAAEAQLSSGAPPKAEAKPEAKPEKFSAKDMVDPKAKRTAKREKMVKPSLDRKHNTTDKTVKYRVR